MYSRFSVPRSKRLAIELVALAAIVVLTVAAAPAFASGTTPFQQVLVVNPASSPIPVTLQGTGAISGSVGVNNFPATQPVSGTVGVNNFPATQPVSGTVNIGNSPTVSLDSTSAGHLASIDSATGGLHYDGSGNLKVAVTAGASSTDPSVADLDIFGSGPIKVTHGGTHSFFAGADFDVTAYSFYTDNNATAKLSSLNGGVQWNVLLPAGTPVTLSFAHAIPVATLFLSCDTNTFNNDCNINYSVVGY